MKYRVAAVSYINTLPFIYGLQLPEVRELVDVTLAHPARCAELLQKGEVDIALCPIGALPGLEQYHLITDYCIGCDGPVRTVSVYSDEPLSELTHVVMFPESRTSNMLAQILIKEYWHYNIEFLSVLPDSPASPILPGYLFIGDICFTKEKEFAFRTDLGQAWKEWTGLPFAFACWASGKQIDDGMVQQLNVAFANGIQNIDNLVFPKGVDSGMMKDYLKENISYEFDAGKRLSMKKYLDLIGSSSMR